MEVLANLNRITVSRYYIHQELWEKSMKLPERVPSLLKFF